MVKKLIGKIERLFFLIKLSLASPVGKGRLYERHLGVKLGENVRFTGHPVWGSEPYLIEIGNDVTITQNVSFSTHDGGVGIFRKKYPGINVFGRIRIGNNVFIGSNTIFLSGVNIGDNVVIGSGSLVSKDIPSNVVAIGRPAIPVKSIEDYEKQTLQKAVYIVTEHGQERKEEVLNKMQE
jgi:acetyltransferase-like isoleucine patch superfamily enzyme